MTLFDLYQPRLSVIATKYAEMMTASNLQKYWQNIFKIPVLQNIKIVGNMKNTSEKWGLLIKAIRENV